mmetsp:Transcript_5299/g.12023  ORF Transcript_5299/g.12023 Transcript_5299/m.12023 type:complete len:724 (-) Transcript_5299:370-2541(-)|eukprot:CAMPEP_0172322612 /NCGR_PEP_ID=MMETSP1058-20130122/46393_1 /TAXON_ID=83371 /ORGANISM="Detonula confervacea, Strain CCMP 353" /LENGTH=723 /DNA_ID=CAMNT_0013038401 /DNA_START=67 /DNA_END=2238 /DNA_ORIENTATION=+
MMRVMGPILLLLLAATDCASAFQLPTRLAQHNAELHYGRTRTTQVHRVMVSLKSKENEEDSRLPFFARAMQKMRPKKESTDDEKGGVLENTDGEEKSVSSDNVGVLETTDREEKSVDSEAALLRALAGKTRLEAEKMELSLTLAKIEKLEDKISETKERSNLLRDTQILMTKMNPPKVKINEVTLATEGIVSNETSSAKSPSTSDSEQKDEKSEVEQLLDGEKPILGEEKREEAIDAFEKLPQQIKDMMARSVGMADGTNSTEAIEKLMEENRLFQGENDEKFSLRATAEDMDVLIDMDFVEINKFVENMLPGVTRKEPVKMEYIDALYSEVLGKDTFNPRERNPQAIPGGYLIRGESKVKSIEGKGDGDVLIEALDKKISESSVAGKIQVYYMLDPTPPSGEEILAGEDETPVLFISNYDVSPETKVWVKPGVSFAGLASIAVFALGSFALNENIVNQADAADGSLGLLLYDLSLPLVYSVLATQIVHELGHLIVAVKDGIQIGLPTLVPGFQFGLTGAITPIKSSPKNIKSLFDFAIAGPLFGLVFSLFLLYTGLEMTAFMDISAQEQLPSIPVEVLRSSALGGGIIDYLLGDGVLNSPDPSSTMIKLHPYAIAGFGGLVINALNLLPLGNTDGGRISLSFFGRSFSRVVQGTALLALVIAGFFGADEINLLLCFAVFANFWQTEAEVPCRNEVDELDSVRGLVAIGMSLIVILTLVPLPS